MTTSEPLDSQAKFYIATINSLGHSVLLETIRSAVFYLNNSNQICKSRFFKLELKEGKSCYAFIQGSGLDAMLNEWNLEYDPFQIRVNFNYLIRHSL